MTRVARWVAFWDEREPPTALACIRIALALVMLVDLAAIGWHGVATWLWAPLEAGGIVGWGAADAPLFYRLLPPSAASAQLLWLGLVLSVLCVGAGFCMRGAALGYVWLSAQAALINGPADRAIDRAVRIMMLILVLSPAAQVWSIDAWRKTGHFRGSPEPAPAWPRYMILAQLVLIYFGAGLAKGGTSWYPWGGYRALYLTLQDPILAAADFRWLARPLPFRLTQVATALTHLWELSAPLVLLAAHYRRRPERARGWRRAFLLVPVRNLYVALGVAFHLTLALTLRLGIFPFAMLACFPAFFRPEELERGFGRLRAGWASAFSRPGNAPSP
ncbi:MAG TPA: HTTM domain-containing protein [Polyangiaceae bacterium]|nr:HTTM domain-containing protein [Polyangiaceae bacterium]